MLLTWSTSDPPSTEPWLLCAEQAQHHLGQGRVGFVGEEQPVCEHVSLHPGRTSAPLGQEAVDWKAGSILPCVCECSARGKQTAGCPVLCFLTADAAGVCFHCL